jgi:HAD superfamily hydrolase (TIGR01509 family)
MINAIIFDLSDTLVAGLTGAGARLEKLLPYSGDEILRQLRGDEMLPFILGRCTEDEYLASLARAHNWPPAIDEIKAVIREHFRSAIPGAREMVLDLAGRHPLYLLSDHGREWAEYIEAQHDFLALFRRRFYSFELHMRKNSAGTYGRVVRMIGASPQECLFIDDRRAFLDAAKEAGLQTLPFEDPAQVMNAVGELETAQG